MDPGLHHPDADRDDKPVVVKCKIHRERCCVSKVPPDQAAREELQRIGRTVASLREWRDLGQEHLAHLSGVTWRHVQRVEAGDGDPALSYYIRLARGLRVPLAWLFTENWRTLAEAGPGEQDTPDGAPQTGPAPH